jgi:hypothetical protein
MDANRERSCSGKRDRSGKALSRQVSLRKIGSTGKLKVDDVSPNDADFPVFCISRTGMLSAELRCVTVQAEMLFGIGLESLPVRRV